MSSDDRHKPILIAGPTASGKSRLALGLAERVGGVVINADSMQVYRDLRVLTARPTPEEEAQVPHMLYGHVPGEQAYSAARFAHEAAAVIATARGKHLVPIVAGGTGLYFRALLEGLSPMPPIPDAIRAEWRGAAARMKAGELHAILAQRDPVMAARLQPTDSQRIVRALEVLDATGRSLAAWQAEPGSPVLSEQGSLCLVVTPERTELSRRIDARLDAMMAAGALDEVAALRDRALDPALPVMRALGVAPLLATLAGSIPLKEAIERAKAETRQYAKRQLTWLRRNMSAWKHVNTQQMESIDVAIDALIQNTP